MKPQSKVVATADRVEENQAAATSSTKWLPTAFPSSTIITIIVGSKKHSFSAHKDVLTAKCPFFANCLASGLEESVSNTVTFPDDDDSRCFLHFFQWIYHEAVPDLYEADKGARGLSLDVKTWVLADKLCMLEWQDRIMTEIGKRTKLIQASKLLWLLENGSQKSMIFRFVWDQLVWTLARYPKHYRKKDEAEHGTGANGLRKLVSSCFAASPIVTIIVGAKRHCYAAHKEKLIEESPFFRLCLNPQMKEGQANEVEFPEDSCVSFDSFFLWIYSRNVPSAATQTEVAGMMKAWVLADKLCMPEWQNKFVDGLADFWRRCVFQPQHLIWLFDNVDQSLPLFLLGFRQLAWDLSSDPGRHQDDYAKELEVLLAKQEYLPVPILFAVVNAKDIAKEPATRPEKYHVRANEPHQAGRIEDTEW
ncbi:hypothetical protein LTR84_007591 [Exophiala bonariae]|uniref:BTB domain-containing protein n=1 Tax=Exophiala bonariae TaxID=1690606 RepID=A0AAV9NPL7_9EURO|nr:hypothetical protein LTR84_007591 [Exophiala bonariae]